MRGISGALLLGMRLQGPLSGTLRVSEHVAQT